MTVVSFLAQPKGEKENTAKEKCPVSIDAGHFCVGIFKVHDKTVKWRHDPRNGGQLADSQASSRHKGHEGIVGAT